MELIVFSGIQCAGKSTFYNKHFSNTHYRINLDTLKTRKRESAEFSMLIDESRPVVIDNTNPLFEDRQRYIALAKSRGYRVTGFQFRIPLSIALQRSKLRRGQKEVPAFVIRNTLNKIQPLAFSEGFDQIFEVGCNGETVAVDGE